LSQKKKENESQGKERRRGKGKGRDMCELTEETARYRRGNCRAVEEKKGKQMKQVQWRSRHLHGGSTGGSEEEKVRFFLRRFSVIEKEEAGKGK